MLDKKAQNPMMLTLKFDWNLATLDVCNGSLEMVITYSKEMFGILHFRSIGYYKMKQGILQQNLSKYYRFESADILCEEFNKFINMLKKEKEHTKDKNPWLEQGDQRRNMSDREILEKYVDLDRSCLSDSEKKQVMDMLYTYKYTFSLRDEIGTGPNIEAEIDVTDKSPFFIRLIMLRKKIKVY